MKAKEKAIELVEKFEKETEHQDSHWDTYEVSKQCALIAVDEQIELLENIREKFLDTEMLSPANHILGKIEKLEEVKQEIKNL